MKSLECSAVLKLLDNDFSYQQAVKAIVTIFRINKTLLEKELNKYI